MNDLEVKLRVIRMITGWDKCLFCKKSFSEKYVEYWSEEYNKDGKGVFLCESCQACYNLLKEIDEERSKINYCLND